MASANGIKRGAAIGINYITSFKLITPELK